MSNMLKRAPVELFIALVGHLTLLSLHSLATYLHLTSLFWPLEVKHSGGIHTLFIGLYVSVSLLKWENRLSWRCTVYLQHQRTVII